MSNERNSHRTAIELFAIAVIIAILAAFVTTLERVDTRTANNETPPGTTGLAKPRAPLDRVPGQPVLGNRVAIYPAGRQSDVSWTASPRAAEAIMDRSARLMGQYLSRSRSAC